MSIISRISRAAAFACALASPSCFFVGDDDGDVSYVDYSGTLTVQLTIDGQVDPGACDYYGATDIELVVYDSRGQAIDTAYAPCEDFGISVDLREGSYSADVTLVDPANNPRSLTLPVEPFDVVQGAELVIDVDFPSGSFL